DREAGGAAADDIRRDPLAVAREHVEDVRVGAVRDPLLRAGDPRAAVGAGAHGGGVAARARRRQRERGQLVSLRERRDEALALLLGAVGDDRQLARAGVHRERDAGAGVAAGHLLDDEDVGDEVGARAAELRRDADTHQPQLAELLEDGLGKRVLAVPGRCLRRDDVVAEARSELADLALLVAELVQAHRRVAIRLVATVRPAVPTSAARSTATPAASLRPSCSKRITSQPCSRATFASVEAAVTATGCP